MKTSSSRIRGFSLLELMVVVLIIGIIAAFAVPAATTILRGSQMMQASQILTDQLSLARQYALSKNHPVEVRFISYIDPEVPGDPGQYRAIQILETLDIIDTTTNDFVRVPLDKPQLLPQAVVINQNTLSSILNEATSTTTAAPTKATPTTKDPSLPRIGTNYSYIYFRFMPDGSTNLPSTGSSSTPQSNGAWYVTLLNVNDNNPAFPPSASSPPPNFFTLQVDPISGTMKQFRPGI